jgi:hypothetical protein
MWGRHEEGMHGMHGMGMEHHPEILWTMWDKLDDKTKKTLLMRKIDERIMMKEQWIQHLQHRIETYKMLKKTIESM